MVFISFSINSLIRDYLFIYLVFKCWLEMLKKINSVFGCLIYSFILLHFHFFCPFSCFSSCCEHIQSSVNTQSFNCALSICVCWCLKANMLLCHYVGPPLAWSAVRKVMRRLMRGETIKGSTCFKSPSSH